MFGKGYEGAFFNIPGVAYGVVKAGGIFTDSSASSACSIFVILKISARC